MSEPIQAISQGNYILQGTVATSAGIVGDGSTQNPLRADETVLWEGILYQVGDTYTQNLSESVRNFSKIQFWVRRRFQAPSDGRCYFIPTVVLTFESTNNALAYINAVDIAGGTYAQNCIYVQFPTNTTVKLLAGTKFSGGTYSNNLQTYEFSIEKIVGVNRIGNS